MRLLLAWLLAILALAGTPALAELPPRPNGPVLDQAAIIPDADEAALDQRLRDYNARTGRAVIIATVSSLDGLAVNEYAQDMAETWDIGGKETEQGVLFLIAPNERKMRIHTNRGLQEYLPDVLAGRIIRNDVTPRFKAGDMLGGINAGVDGIVTQLDRSPADAKAVAEAAAAAERSNRGRGDGGSGSVFFWLFLIVVLMMLFSRRRRGYGRSGIDPGIIIWGASEILNHSNRGGGFGGGFGGGDSGGGFGGFGGGGGGFDGGGASGSW